MPAGVGRHIGVAVGLDGLHRAAAAGAVDQPYDRQPKLVRHLLRHHLLLPDGGIGGAAAHREVVAADHDRSAVDPAASEHEIGRLQRLKLAVVAVAAAPRDRADLVEAVRVEQAVDALAHREPAGIVLALDLFGPAHLPGERLAPPQFFDLGFPAHPAPRISTIGTGDYSIRRHKGAGRGMAEITVRSELNAIVWKIEVAAGTTVGEGDMLMILESMKMEIPVTAPRNGAVKTILVTEGEQVAEGQPLAVLEPGS